jgi:hypothetical protein
MQHEAEDNDLRKTRILGMVFFGCDREIAAHSVGWSKGQLRVELKADEQFSLELARNEGLAELHHMKLVHKATEDEKNWRAATWWLDRRSKDRKERAGKRVITPDEITEFVEELVEIVFAEVKGETDRDRLAVALFSAVNEEDRGNVAKLLRQMGLEQNVDRQELEP